MTDSERIVELEFEISSYEESYKNQCARIYDLSTRIDGLMMSLSEKKNFIKTSFEQEQKIEKLTEILALTIPYLKNSNGSFLVEIIEKVLTK